MSPEKDKPTDQRSRLRRMLEWNLPGSLVMFRSDRSPLAWLMPELKQFDSPKHRSTAFRKTWHRAVSLSPRFWLFAIAWFAATMLFIMSPIGASFLRHNHPVYYLLIECFWIMGITLFPLLHFRNRIRRDLRRQLFEQGRPICVACGYNLTGNKSGRCPECGREIRRPSVGNAGSDNNAPLPRG